MNMEGKKSEVWSLNAGMKETILRCACVGGLLLGVAAGHAQELERDLQCMPEEAGRPAERAAVVAGGGDALLPPVGLPFVDDFAWPSLYHEEGPVNVKRWEPSPVRRTFTMASNPPTIGCAALDGLAANGLAYELNPLDPEGWTDTLTSRRLLLEPYATLDSVALSFWYQCGGLGNGPDEGSTDRLYVDFKNSAMEWVNVAEIEGIDNDLEFHPYVIHITDTAGYLHNAFQFRFRTYGSTEGNVDVWLLDYVTVREDGMVPAPEFEEIAFVTKPSSFLVEPWTAMPWPHFVLTQNAYTADEAVTVHRSFGEGSNSQQNIGMKAQRVDQLGSVNEWTPPAGNVPNNAVSGLFTTDYVGETNPVPLFNPAISGFPTFHVSLWETEVGAANETNQDGVTDNDSIVHVQTFQDYYAYDDGSAEKAWALDGIGGELALRFDLEQPDTLEGVMVHFTPFFDDATPENFVLKIRGEDPDNPGQPGEALQEQFTLHQPQYFTDGYDQFQTYLLDEPIAVSGAVFVGFIQEDDRINVGLDKNTNTNPDYLWYKFPSTDWNASTIEGSLMIRPRLRVGQGSLAAVSDPTSAPAPAVFPNPGRGTCLFDLTSPSFVTIRDASGRLVEDLGLCQEGRVEWNAPEPGSYLVEGRNQGGASWTEVWINQE